MSPLWENSTNMFTNTRGHFACLLQILSTPVHRPASWETKRNGWALGSDQYTWVQIPATPLHLALPLGACVHLQNRLGDHSVLL